MATTFTNADNPVFVASGLQGLKLKNSILAKVNHRYLGADTETRTAVRVPYISSIGSASVWTAGASNGYSSNTNTLTGLDLVFVEPIYKTFTLSPNQANSYDIGYVSTVIIPSTVEAVVEECEKQVETFLDATTLPVQYTSSVASYDMVESGSQVCYASSSNADQFTVVSAKFDRQLKTDLKNSNYIVGAQVVAGSLRDGYPCGNTDVVPAYGLENFSTGADAAVITPDTILVAARMPAPLPNSSVVTQIVDPSLNFPILFFIWTHPVDGTLNFTSATQFIAGRGRTGHGARLKIN
jgi:hypothetical protein